MRKILLALTAFFAFSINSNAQCNAQFTYSFIDCDSVYFVPTSIGPQYTYYWNFGDGNSSTAQSPTHEFSADGSYAVILVLSDTVAGCTDVLTVPIDINCGTPCNINGAWTYSVNSTDCNVQFVSTAFGGTAPYTYYWDFGDGSNSTLSNPVHQYPNNTTYTPCLTITDANGCDTTICMPIGITCSPTSCDATFTHSFASCDSVFFIPVSQGAQYAYHWDFGDGQSSTNMYPSHQYVSNGTYAVVLDVTDTILGCTSVYTGIVIVDCATTCSVNGAFAYFQDSITCEIDFISTAFGGTPPYTFFWNFGDGTTSTDPHPSHQYPPNSAWTPCLTITDANGCDTMICEVVGNNCSPTSCDAQFTFSHVTCDSLWFYPASIGNQFSYSWDFGDGSTSTQAVPTHQYTADGVYIVNLTVYDSLAGCSDNFLLTIVISCGSSCTVDGDFAYSLDTLNCEIQFVSTAFGGTAPYTYYWAFGDGTTSTSPNPIHVYPTSGTWTPCLTITDANGCDTTFCLPVNSFCSLAPCNSDFTFNYASCDSVWFAPNNVSNTALYTWYFGDGTTSNDPITAHQYTSDGVYVVVLEMWDSLTQCYDSSYYSIDIDCGANCSVNGAISWIADSVTCEIQFVSTAFGGTYPYTYFWDFGDGTTGTGPSPTHTYPNNTTFTPCLTITDANGCDTTICDVVYSTCIGSSCDAIFTYTHVACDSVWFIPASNGSQYSYWWDFGDGTTSTQSSPAHQFTANGTYTVVLYIADSLTGCNNAYTMIVDINCGFSPCGVNGAFFGSVDSVGCTAYFTSTAFGGTAPYTYYWNFGDGSTSSQAHPVHTYPSAGVYTPCLTITDANGCDTTICDVITTWCTAQTCDPSFTYSYITCDSIWFVPNTLGSGITYYWDFGDGTTGSGMYPSHQYASNGTYIVVLGIVDSNNVCNGSYTVLVDINCNNNCNLGAVVTSVSDTSNCGVLFASSSYGGTQPYTYYWDFGDSTFSNQPHPSHTYNGPGPWIASFTVTDANGCDTTVYWTVVPNCNPLSVQEESQADIIVYPNPSEGQFYLQTEDVVNIMIYDLGGQLIYSDFEVSGLIELDLSDFGDGAYILKGSSETGSFVRRLIKQ